MKEENYKYFIYGLVAKCVLLLITFTVVSNSIDEYVDEIYHIKQAELFCNGTFKLLPKISTLPGLYFISVAVLKPFQLCTHNGFRIFNCVASIINYILLYKLLKKVYKIKNKNAALISFSIGVTSPILFFDVLYYNETLSITLILAMLVYQYNKNYLLSATFGFLAILVRQVNVIWVFYSMLFVLLARFQLSMLKSPQKLINYLFKRSLFILPYISVIMSFVMFVIFNKGVAVGDHNAHSMTIHLMQVFYFALFIVMFSAVNFIGEIFRLQFISPYGIIKYATTYLILLKNLQVHPYLLADNRHYTFYLWNYFGRYQYQYIFLVAMFHYVNLSVINIRLNSFMNSISYNILYICTILSLIFHQLVDVRYFFVPFILFKIQLRESFRNCFIQVIINLLIHSIVLLIFSTKEIYWENFQNVQRLGW